MSSFIIEDAYYITGIGTILVGRVASGDLRPGMKSRVNDRVIAIKSIEQHHSQLSVARVGDNVGISIKQLSSDEGFFAKLFNSQTKLYNLFKKSRGRQLEFY